MRNSLYIFLGCTIDTLDQGYQSKTYFKSGVSVSNSEYERKLLAGFINTNSNCVFISAPVCGTWPLTSKKSIIKGFRNSEQLVTVEYNCTLGVRNYSKTKVLFKKLKEIVDNNYNAKDIHIIACELHKPYLICLKKIKKLYSNIFTTTIVLDLPKHVNAGSKFKAFLKKKENEKVLSLARRYSDSYVCLTKPLAELFKDLNKPMVVSEGIVEAYECNNNFPKLKTPHCLYIGKVDKRNGIDIIVETAKLMPTVIFDICGTGDFDTKKLNSIANIKYHGFVSQKDAESMIEESDIVLSPRIPSGEEYLMYSFPSKIFSYIAHRKPIISYMIPCYKDTLFERALFFPDSFSSLSMAAMINELILNKCKYPKELYNQIFCMYSPEKIAQSIKNLKTRK